MDRKANKIRTQPNRDPGFLSMCLQRLTFVTDDVLFNAMSLLDYVANLVSSIIDGPDEHKRKWNGTVRSMMNPTSRMASSSAGRVMLTLHREWVDKLHGVRSARIHNRTFKGDGVLTIRLLAHNALHSTLAFQLAPQVARKLPFLRTLEQDGAVDLMVGTEQIAYHAIEAATEVMTALRQDVDRILMERKKK
jgi:hypothetical protein